MIKYTTGDMFEADVDALVNTVNCEGYMGKGIAYQFKLRFPQNNDSYKEACRRGEFGIGKILANKEGEKWIINFPTKDKWRKKSKYEYIELGMQELIRVIPELGIDSIAIPPLGCGNGGLEWANVKAILEGYIREVEADVDFLIYEPSSVPASGKAKRAPKLNTSHLILMLSKSKLDRFNKIRLQKTAYLLNYFSAEDYFKFDAYNFGPYANSIAVLSRDIKEFQQFYSFDTNKAVEWAKNTLISTSVLSKIRKYESALDKAVKLVNRLENDKDLELQTTLLYILEKKYPLNKDEVIDALREWSERKASIFSATDIENALIIMQKEGLITRSIDGFEPVLKKKVTA